MIKEQKIFAIRKNKQSRKSWLCSNGKLGTVEEVAKDYYVDKRGFKKCLIDSACVYGGLSWMLFHDILFHDNLSRKQPLCSLYLYSPVKFFERHKNAIEERLSEYRMNRSAVFARQMSSFCNHPFFKNFQSNILKYHGTWMKRHCSDLAYFAFMSPEHEQERLISEIIKTSIRGRNAGWPDLVAWNESDLVFAEVKSTDRLSDAQIQWIADHKDKVNIELIRIIEKE